MVADSQVTPCCLRVFLQVSERVPIRRAVSSYFRTLHMNQAEMFIFHDEIRHIFMKNLACRGKCSYFMMKFVIFYEEFGLQRANVHIS